MNFTVEKSLDMNWAELVQYIHAIADVARCRCSNLTIPFQIMYLEIINVVYKISNTPTPISVISMLNLNMKSVFFCYSFQENLLTDEDENQFINIRWY